MRDRPVVQAGWRACSVTWWLIGIQVVLFLVVGAAGGANARGSSLSGFIQRELWLHPTTILDGWKLWQPFTAMWFYNVDLGLGHLLLNVLLLYALGSRCEVSLSLDRRRYLLLYLGGGITFALAQVAAASLGVASSPSLGASGSIFALIAYALMALGDEPVRLFGIWRMSMRTFAWIALGACLLFYVFSLPVPPAWSIGHAVALAWGWHAARRTADVGVALRVSLPDPAPPPPVPEAEEPEEPDEPDAAAEDVRGRVDRLLEKITDDGMGSLSAEERAFLEDASKRFR